MICSELQNSVWINGQKSIGNPRLKLKIHDFQCITDVGVASSRLAELELLRYKKRGQSKLTLQLTSFVVREMRVELTRRN